MVVQDDSIEGLLIFIKACILLNMLRIKEITWMFN